MNTTKLIQGLRPTTLTGAAWFGDLSRVWVKHEERRTAWCVVVAESADTVLDTRTVIMPKTQRRLDQRARAARQPRCLDRGCFVRADGRNDLVVYGPAWAIELNQDLYVGVNR